MDGHQLLTGQASGTKQNNSDKCEDNPGCSQHAMAGDKAQIGKNLPVPNIKHEGYFLLHFSLTNKVFHIILDNTSCNKIFIEL